MIHTILLSSAEWYFFSSLTVFITTFFIPTPKKMCISFLMYLFFVEFWEWKERKKRKKKENFDGKTRNLLITYTYESCCNVATRIYWLRFATLIRFYDFHQRRGIRNFVSEQFRIQQILVSNAKNSTSNTCSSDCSYVWKNVRRLGVLIVFFRERNACVCVYFCCVHS